MHASLERPLAATRSPGAFVEACALDVGAWPEVHDLPADSNAVAQRVPRAWAQRAGDGCCTACLLDELGELHGIVDGERARLDLPWGAWRRAARKHGEFVMGCVRHAHSIGRSHEHNQAACYLTRQPRNPEYDTSTLHCKAQQRKGRVV